MGGLSKETRIKIFIAIDTIFFLIEIIIGAHACPQRLPTIRRSPGLTGMGRLLCTFFGSRRRRISYGKLDRPLDVLLRQHTDHGGSSMMSFPSSSVFGLSALPLVARATQNILMA